MATIAAAGTSIRGMYRTKFIAPIRDHPACQSIP
jgi:hypothetical protein